MVPITIIRIPVVVTVVVRPVALLGVTHQHGEDEEEYDSKNDVVKSCHVLKHFEIYLIGRKKNIFQ